MTESLVVHGSSSVAVIARVRAAFERMQEYVLSEPADDVLQVARGAGRRSRRSEFCTIRAIQEPQQLVVTLSGHLGPTALDVVRNAVHATSTDRGALRAVESFQPAPTTATPTSFVAPTDWFVTPDTQPDPGPRTGAQPRTGDSLPPPAVMPVAAETGHDTMLRSPAQPSSVARTTRPEVVLRVGQSPDRTVRDLLLIGRAPAPRPTDPTHAQTLEIADPALSKTHLAVGRSGDDVWVEDRNSSNGTSWSDARNVEHQLNADVRVTIELPCQVRAGDSVIWIGWGA